MRQLIKVVIVLAILAGLGWAGYAWYARRNSAATVTYRTAAVERGDLLVTIGATGTVEPEEVIDVGAQVAGQINYFGKDKNGKTIDYGSTVEEGMVLAQIDQSLYDSDVATAKAQQAEANSAVTRAKADLEQLKAKLLQAQNDWERAQRLGPSEALAQSAYDAYRAGYETAKANLAVGDAAITQAQATVAAADATFTRAARNLGYTTIKSPVKGVIIDRRVNIGQTVVASLNAPSLFLIAKDLQRMQVWVAVNEADIGSIHAGQPVTFTVDAFHGETFKGEVGKVRLNASMTQNVVTYTVEVLTDNSSGRLLPYLTANVQFEVSRKSDVLKVPNAALRWTPPDARIAPDAKSGERSETARSETRPADGAAPTTRPRRNPSDPDAEPTRGVLWVKDGEFVRPIRVNLGLTDGISREVKGKDLTEGIEVITGEVAASNASATGTTNPFAPPQMGRRRAGGGAGGR